MRILGALVEPLVLAMFEFHLHFRARGTVRAELISDQHPRSAGLFTDELAQEPLGGATVTTALNQSVNDEAVLINGAPKPMLFAIDGDDDLIEMPLVAELGRASPDAIREFPPEFLGPAPDGFMANDNPARCKKVFNHS